MWKLETLHFPHFVLFYSLLAMYWNLSIFSRWTLKFLTICFKYKIIMFLGILKKILMKQIIFTLSKLFLFFMETIFPSILLEVFTLHSLWYVVTAFIGIICFLTPHNLQFPANLTCALLHSLYMVYPSTVHSTKNVLIYGHQTYWQG